MCAGFSWNIGSLAEFFLSHTKFTKITKSRTRFACAGLWGVGAHNNLLSPADGHGWTQIFASRCVLVWRVWPFRGEKSSYLGAVALFSLGCSGLEVIG